MVRETANFILQNNIYVFIIYSFLLVLKGNCQLNPFRLFNTQEDPSLKYTMKDS